MDVNFFQKFEKAIKYFTHYHFYLILCTLGVLLAEIINKRLVYSIVDYFQPSFIALFNDCIIPIIFIMVELLLISFILLVMLLFSAKNFFTQERLIQILPEVFFLTYLPSAILIINITYSLLRYQKFTTVTLLRNQITINVPILQMPSKLLLYATMSFSAVIVIYVSVYAFLEYLSRDIN